MSRLADVNPLELITSTWGNTIRDRTITPFTNATERASQWPSPHDGAVSWLIDVESIEVWNGAAWEAVTGGGGGPVAYRHVQDTPSATWTVTHSLGFRPAITTLCNLGTLTEVRGQISHSDANTVSVSFATPVTGELLLS